MFVVIVGVMGYKLIRPQPSAPEVAVAEVEPAPPAMAPEAVAVAPETVPDAAGPADAQTEYPDSLHGNRCFARAILCAIAGHGSLLEREDQCNLQRRRKT